MAGYNLEMEIEKSLGKLYTERFKDEQLLRKDAVWKVLCNHFFQKYVPRDSFVLDIGAGYCEFINNIQCARKIAVDTNQDTTRFASEEVTVINCLSTDLSCFSNGSVDIVFMSNFLEHLASKDDIIRTLVEVYRILKAGGSVMILQPNIRYLYKEYWDFFDHCTPLSDKSLVEVLQTVGFIIQEIFPKFLPYTTKSRIPQSPLLVKMYLKMRLVWKIMGKQTFVLGKKPCMTPYI